jgi:hypothetical protein
MVEVLMDELRVVKVSHGYRRPGKKSVRRIEEERWRGRGVVYILGGSEAIKALRPQLQSLGERRNQYNVRTVEVTYK